MVFTQAQTEAIFEHADQMAIPHDTMQHLTTKGIALVQDPEEIDKTLIIAMAKDFRSLALPLEPRARNTSSVPQSRQILHCLDPCHHSQHDAMGSGSDVF